MSQQTFDRLISGIIAILLIVASLAVVTIDAIHGDTSASLPPFLQSVTTLVIGYYFGAHGRDLTVNPAPEVKGN